MLTWFSPGLSVKIHQFLTLLYHQNWHRWDKWGEHKEHSREQAGPLLLLLTLAFCLSPLSFLWYKTYGSNVRHSLCVSFSFLKEDPTSSLDLIYIGIGHSRIVSEVMTAVALQGTCLGICKPIRNVIMYIHLLTSEKTNPSVLTLDILRHTFCHFSVGSHISHWLGSVSTQ